MRGGWNELLERFLASHANHHTRRAYRTDLKDFARARNRAPAEAIAELLAGLQRGRRLTKITILFAYRPKPDRP